MFESKLFEKTDPASPVVIAVFSFRHDAHLVPDFIANLRPFVSGYVAWDDREATAELSSEPDRRNRLLARAREMGARWILAADPDERFEASMAKRMPKMLAMGETNLWAFPIREMFTPDSYRIDGIWGRKRRLSLFPARAVGRDLNRALHGAWIADRTGFRVRDAEANIYHFRMATPERRRLRRELYAAADPTRQFQAVGYDFLDDARGMVLETIPKGREFLPAFQEDHGLWSPDPGNIGKIVADPIACRWNLVRDVLSKCGHGQASFAVEDLAAANTDDPDLLPIAAMLALTAGDPQRARALAASGLVRAPESALALYLRGKAAAAIGDRQGLISDTARLQGLVGDCHLLRDLQSEASRAVEDFGQDGAQWRRWVPGAASCLEGKLIADAPMSVVVLGYKAPVTLAAAVASLRAQDAPCEIIVVNSGGGDIQSVLADHLDHIRLITTDVHLFVGAARNIGIDASRGRLIGFLAGDCRALPCWVSGRLREHDHGARSVSNPVVPEAGAGALAIASIGARYHSRSPGVNPARASHYGRSYTREVLALAGYFPIGLRVSEDTFLNRSVDILAPCVWAPDVLTAHVEPNRFLGLILENYSRGFRLSDHPPFRSRPGEARNIPRLWSRLFDRYVLPDKRSIDAGSFKLLNPGTVAVGSVIAFSQFLGLLRGLGRQAKANKAQQNARKTLAARRGPDSDSQAISDLRAAIKLDPQDAGKLVFLGETLVSRGQDGSDAFRQALAVDPAGSGALSDLLESCLARGDLQHTFATAEAAAQNAPQVSEHWQAAAEIAAQLGQVALAIAYTQRALSLAPHRPAAHEKAEELYRKIGNPAAAGHRRATIDLLEADLARGKV